MMRVICVVRMSDEHAVASLVSRPCACERTVGQLVTIVWHTSKSGYLRPFYK